MRSRKITAKRKASQRRVLYERIIAAIGKLQRRNRFISAAPTQFRLSLLETMLLIELQADEMRVASQLVNILRIEQGHLSRVITGLVERKFLKTVSHKSDQRRKSLSLLTNAKRAVHQVDLHANQQFERMNSRVASRDIALVIELFRSIADGLGQPEGIQRKIDPSYRVQQRRITCALGLLSGQVYGSDLNTLQHLTLDAIRKYHTVSTTQLCEALLTPMNTMSANLRALEGRGYICRADNLSDRRSSYISLTPSGEKKLDEVVTLACRQLETALHSVSVSQLTDSVAAFERCVNCEDVIMGRYFIRAIESETDRRVARTFLLRSLVREKRESEAPEVLIGAGHPAFGLFDNNILCGLTQFDCSRGRPVFEVGVFSKAFSSPSEQKAFLHEVESRLVLKVKEE